MSAFRVRVRGRGRAEVAAYGLADAEHQVEKEIARAWPGVRVAVEGVERRDGEGRIVETFTVRFAAEGWVEAKGEDADAARGAAFRAARERLRGTRYRGMVWEATATQPAA